MTFSAINHINTAKKWLLLLVLFVGVQLLSSLPVVSGLARSESGTVDLGGVVPATPPSQAAVITTPLNGRHFKQAHITVAGTCPVTTIVEIYKNDVFAGSTSCSSTGTFSIEIDLFQGENRLKARIHDNLNQYGPDSATITVYYDSSQIIAQLAILASNLSQGEANVRPLKLDIVINGGLAPYALSVEWGDGSAQDLLSKANNEKFTISHLYETRGNYKIIIRATDSIADSAYLEVVGLVNGPIYKNINTTAALNNKLAHYIDILFIALPIILIIFSTFWAGERWEYRELSRDDKIK